MLQSGWLNVTKWVVKCYKVGGYMAEKSAKIGNSQRAKYIKD